MKIMFLIIFILALGLVGTTFALDDKTQYPTMMTLEEHYEIEIVGLKDEYVLGEEYSFSFVISGYGDECAAYEVRYPDANGYVVGIGAEHSCDPNIPPHEFEIDYFASKGTLGNAVIKNPGTYVVTITFDKPNKYFSTTSSKEFQVIEPIMGDFTILSPLKQFKMGIPTGDIQCKENLVLIQKYDGSPACVKSITVDKLHERGWTDPLTTYFCLSEYLPVCGIDDVTYSNRCFMEKSGVELKHNGECDNVTFSEYQLDETEFLQIKNNMENVGYHICDIQLEENKILISLNWIFEDSEPEKMILSQIPSNVSYEIKYLDEYSDYFLSKESLFACDDSENKN